MLGLLLHWGVDKSHKEGPTSAIITELQPHELDDLQPATTR